MRIDPSEVRIESIKVLSFPAKQTNGDDWDNTSTGRPDLWIRVYRSTTILHEQPGSTAISNAISTDNNTYTPSSAIVLTLEDAEHIIKLYDYD